MTPEEHKRIRKGFGLSQAQLAAVLGVRTATVSDRETGRKPISTETALLLRYMMRHGLPD